MGRALQDYIVLYFGSSVFKVTRLLAVAMLCVHCFACAFFKVKQQSAASPDDVDQFYLSRGVQPTVSTTQCTQPFCCSLVTDFSSADSEGVIFWQDLQNAYVSRGGGLRRRQYYGISKVGC
jgi:hypothetical protein